MIPILLAIPIELLSTIASSGIIILILNELRREWLLISHKAKVYRFLNNNRSLSEELKWYSSASIANEVNLAEERVRNICQIHKEITMSPNDNDLWGLRNNKPNPKALRAITKQLPFRFTILLVLVLVISSACTYIMYVKINQPLELTVQVHEINGLPIPPHGEILINFHDTLFREFIKEKETASFKEIPKQYKSDSFYISLGERFDTMYSLKDKTHNKYTVSENTLVVYLIKDTSIKMPKEDTGGSSTQPKKPEPKPISLPPPSCNLSGKKFSHPESLDGEEQIMFTDYSNNRISFVGKIGVYGKHINGIGRFTKNTISISGKNFKGQLYINSNSTTLTGTITIANLVYPIEYKLTD